MRFSTPSILSALLPLAAAQIQYTEPTSMLSYNMSSITTSSGTDLHFNMSIPSSHGWGAIGIGNQMTNALMFILLPDSTNGSTISLRTATGHRMPTQVSGMTLDVMSGSSENGIYHASAVCRQCQTWNDGSLDAQSTGQSFVYSIGPGTSGVSGSGQGAIISMHSYHGQFTIDMTKAAVSADTNGNPQTSSPSSSTSGSSTSGNNGVTSSSASTEPPLNLVMAHATLLGITFGIFLPIGVISLRVASMGWKPHAAVQILGSVLAICGLGIAIHMSLISTEFSSFNTPHQIVGLVAICLLLANVFLGVAHHAAYVKLQRRSIMSHVHLWTGRVVMLLGIINIILGFLLIENMAGAIGVGVVGLLIYLATFAFAMFSTSRQAKHAKVGSIGDASSNVDVVEHKPSNGLA